MAKSYKISKKIVYEAYKKVKANQGAAGVDEETIEEFDGKLGRNLYKIWNRLSSGSYYPPPVKGVPIPKKSGGIRTLGIPTISDRVAQMVVKMTLEPVIEPIFHRDSYGYRPNRSAIGAVGLVRKRSWKYDWVVEFDIKGLFDNISHELLMKAVIKHSPNDWTTLYIERWLKAPIKDSDGIVRQRHSGTPQGGVISPLLANLFMHYAFDRWITDTMRSVRFVRYADDAVVHCKSKSQAELVLTNIAKRFSEVGLELHPTKTKIVYCKDENRIEDYENVQFTFLGYTFRPRKSRDKYGRIYLNFLPAVSRDAVKAMRQTIRSWHIQLKSDRELVEIGNMFNSTLRGWNNYYSRFYESAMYAVWKHLNMYLARWMRRKYKQLSGHKRKAIYELGKIARQNQKIFFHWSLGYLPSIG
jgi:RNA-directed DNA polymerase